MQGTVLVTATPAPACSASPASLVIFGTTNPQTVVMNGPRNVTAVFELIRLQQLVITWNNLVDITDGTTHRDERNQDSNGAGVFM